MKNVIRINSIEDHNNKNLGNIYNVISFFGEKLNKPIFVITIRTRQLNIFFGYLMVCIRIDGGNTADPISPWVKHLDGFKQNLVCFHKESLRFPIG